MKSLFPSYYPLDEQELNELWDNATFVFDTNILIDLFRAKESTSDPFINALNSIKDRIFIPHQVALEFLRNYPKAIEDHSKTFIDIEEKITSSFKSLNNQIKEKNLESRHAEIDPLEITNKIDEYQKELIKTVKHLKENSTFKKKSEETLMSIHSIIDGKIGSEFDHTAFQKEFKEADRRIKESIPPGYKDKSKEKERDFLPHFIFNNKKYSRSHGDYFYWKQTLEHCNENKINHLIIVTNDKKEDWWELDSSKRKIGPRKELREEAKINGVTYFHMYSSDSFLSNFGKRNSSVNISEDALEDLRSLQRENSKDITSFFEMDEISRHNHEIQRKYRIFLQSSNPKESAFRNIKLKHNYIKKKKFALYKMYDKLFNLDIEDEDMKDQLKEDIDFLESEISELEHSLETYKALYNELKSFE